MEYFYEKVYTVSVNKNFLIDIYSVGKKVHKQINCDKECKCLKFLNELDNIIEKMETEELNLLNLLQSIFHFLLFSTKLIKNLVLKFIV